MTTRRQIVKFILIYSAVISAGMGRLGNSISIAWAKAKKRIVEKGTPMSSLMHADPADLDTKNLETSPLEAFDVMGETTHRVDLDSWRLTIEGAVTRPSQFTYKELLARPLLERNVLLICAGFFAYNGRWRGFSVAQLLKEAGVDPGATRIKFTGSEGFQKKTRLFGMDELIDDRLFLAYSVNDRSLPERHGYPLRLVAEGHKGMKWIKYINTITVVA